MRTQVRAALVLLAMLLGIACVETRVSYIPSGSLIIAPYNPDDYPTFVSEDGVILSPPDNDPLFDTDGFGTTTNGIIQLDNGRFGVTNLGNYQVGVFNPDTTLRATDGGTDDPCSIAGGYDTDFFYGFRNYGGTYSVGKFSSDTSLRVNSWSMGTNTFDTYALAVAKDESYAYFARTAFVAAADVIRRDLAALTSSTFATVGGAYPVRQNAMFCLRDGTLMVAWSDGVIRHYSTAGAVLHSYTRSDVVAITPGLTDDSFWVLYQPPASAWSARKIEVSSGTVLKDWALPTNGAGVAAAHTGSSPNFDWGATFAVVRVANGTPTYTQPPTPLCRPIVNLTTVSPNPGCNAGGIGWVPEYTGASGVVPTISDPSPGELLTGKRGAYIDVEIQHTSYPSEAVEVLRYAVVDLDDTEYKQGRVQSIGDIEHGLSDAQGNLQAATIDIHLMDSDGRPIGTRMAADTTKYFARDEISVHARSDWGRRNAATPRMIGRGILTGESYGTTVVAHLTATDPLFADGGSFGPDKKVPQWTYPWHFYSNGPPDITRLFMPLIFGEVSDEGAIDPATGLVNSRGKCPLTFVGMDGLGTGPGAATEQWGRFNICLFASYKVIGLYGADCGGMGLFGRANATSDGASPSVVTLGGSPNLSTVPTDSSAQLVLFTTDGPVKTPITAVDNTAKTVTLSSQILAAVATAVDWYISPVSYTPKRIKIDLSTRNGDDVMVPKWPNYIRPKDYEDFIGVDGDYRATDCWVRGPMLAMHLTGECTLAANVIGIEDKGDATGLPITDYFTAYNFFIDNCVHRQLQRPQIPIAGELFWPQTNGEVPLFSDGVSKTKQSSFAAAQAASRISLGGDGLKVSAYFGDGISIRDAFQLWNDNGGCRIYIDEWGRIGVWVFEETANPLLWPRIEHVSRVFGDVQRVRAHEEIQNIINGSCDWDPDGEKFREPLEPIVCTDAIMHNKGIPRPSKHIEGKLLANKTHFQFLLTQYARFQQDGPVYVRIENCDEGLLDYPVGSGIQFTSIMGPGAAGYVDEPLIILRKIFHVDAQTVTLLCLSVRDQLYHINRAAGRNAVAIVAAPATRVAAAVTRAAGTNTVAMSAPAARSVQVLAAGTQGLIVTAPVATAV